MKGTLLIGGLPRILIPVARNLQSHGIPVHGASVGPAGRVLHSRALQSFTVLGANGEDPKRFFAALRQLIEDHAIDTILPCGDEALLALAPHEEEIRRLVHYAGPSAPLCRAILNKPETLALASAAGVPVPGEYQVNSVQALSGMENAIRFPIVIKPRNKDVEEITGIKSEILNTFTELSEYFERFPEFGSWFLIQDYIPGGGVAIVMLIRHGTPLVTFQHRRVSEYPARGGVSVQAESEIPDPLIVQHALALLRTMQWEGVAMVEFRQDLSTGRLALMEVNGRFWGSVALPLLCGMEFPYYVWQLGQGQDPRPPLAYPSGVRFRWSAGNLKRVYERLVAPGDGKLAALTAFLRSHKNSTDALWSWSDPLPAWEESARAFAAIGLMAAGAAAKKLVSGPVYRRAKALRHAGVSSTLAYMKMRFVSRPGISLHAKWPIRSVVFICHGNIIRSPMAEAVFRSQNSGIRVESAGTSAMPGRDVDLRAARVAKEFGVSLEGHTAKRISADAIAASDLLVVMDYINYGALLDSFPEVAHKTMLLATGPNGALEIDDPFDGTIDDIRASYRLVQNYTRSLLKTLQLPTVFPV